MDFLLAYPWLIPLALLISTGLTYLFYAYNEYRWPFDNLRPRK